MSTEALFDDILESDANKPFSTAYEGPQANAPSVDIQDGEALFPFGKPKREDRKFCEVRKGYLKWALNNIENRSWREMCVMELVRRGEVGEKQAAKLLSETPGAPVPKEERKHVFGDIPAEAAVKPPEAGVVEGEWPSDYSDLDSYQKVDEARPWLRRYPDDLAASHLLTPGSRVRVSGFAGRDDAYGVLLTHGHWLPRREAMPAMIVKADKGWAADHYKNGIFCPNANRVFAEDEGHASFAKSHDPKDVDVATKKYK